MALLFASNRWGNGRGIYDYKAHALKLLHDMVNRQSISGTVNSAGRKIPVPPIPADPYELGTVIVTMPAAPASAPTAGPVRGRGPRTVTIGKEVSAEHYMILFSPDERNNFSDPSYHLPAFYELWARWGPEGDRGFWARAADVSRDYFHKSAHATTGLIPNYANFDGTPNRGAPAFREDAWRCAMNWSFDVSA